MTPARNINIKYLRHYSLSKEGRVFLGDKEITGIWADANTYQFALYPSNNKRYPVPFRIEDLWKATFCTRIPNNTKKQLKPDKQPTVYREVFLQDSNGEKASFQSIRYAARFLNTPEHKVLHSIKHKTPIGKFKITATEGKPAFNG